jgi:hypothetical protein
MRPILAGRASEPGAGKPTFTDCSKIRSGRFIGRQQVNPQRYRLGMADGVCGPGDVAPLSTTDDGSIRGPDLPNWQKEYMLLICEEPVIWRGDLISFLEVSPRYVGATLASIRREGVLLA